MLEHQDGTGVLIKLPHSNQYPYFTILFSGKKGVLLL
nr:MAG TPA: hypothetical protein [Caudoviricetes sp.]